MLILNKNLKNYYRFALSKRQQRQISRVSKKQTCGIMKTLDVSHTTERQAFTCLLIYFNRKSQSFANRNRSLKTG